MNVERNEHNDVERVECGRRCAPQPSDPPPPAPFPSRDQVKQALDKLGFLPGETVQLATKVMGKFKVKGKFKRWAVHVSDVDETVLQPQQDSWIGSNPIKPEGRDFKKDRVSLIRNIVVDVDYNEPGHHKRESPYADAAAATKAIEPLPQPTYVQDTGGGIHAFWRLSEQVAARQ